MRLLRQANVPIEFVMDCKTERVSALGQERLVTHFSATFGVLLRFYPKIDGVSCQVNVRGQQDRFDQLKESVIHFCRVTHTAFVSDVYDLSVHVALTFFFVRNQSS